MRSNQPTLATAAMVPIPVALASCASKPPPATAETTFIESKDGGAIVETYQGAATVVGINFDTRKVTPGDGVTAQLTEAVAILVEKS